MKNTALKHLAEFVKGKLNAETVFPEPRDERQAAYAAALRSLADDLETIRGWGSPK